METVAANAKAFVELIGQGVKIGPRGKCLVKGRVKDCYLGQFRGPLQGDLYAQEVGWVVKRRQRHQRLKLLKNLTVDENRLPETLATVVHAVTNGHQIFKISGQARVADHLSHGLDGLLMIEHSQGLFYEEVFASETHEAFLFPDPLHASLGQGQEFREREKLELEGRRARVQDQDHFFPPWAWIAVMATVFTMSCTVHPRERSLTGFFKPCKIGPMAVAPADR